MFCSTEASATNFLGAYYFTICVTILYYFTICVTISIGCFWNLRTPGARQRWPRVNSASVERRRSGLLRGAHEECLPKSCLGGRSKVRFVPYDLQLSQRIPQRNGTAACCAGCYLRIQYLENDATYVQYTNSRSYCSCAACYILALWAAYKCAAYSHCVRMRSIFALS